MLVIGGSSFVGKNIYSLSTSKNIFTYTNNKINEKFIKFDLKDLSTWDNILKYEEQNVLILAGITNPIDCYTDIELSNKVNVHFLKEFINELFLKNKKIIFASTEYVFDGNYGNYDEFSKENPILTYGIQKKLIEDHIKLFNKDHLILRFPKIISRNVNQNSLISNWVYSLNNNHEIICTYDQIFSPIAVEDLIKVIDTTVNKGLNGTFHVSGPDKLSRIEYLNILLKYYNHYGNYKGKIIKKSINDFGFKERWPLNVSLNNKKIQDILDFKIFSFEENVRNYFDL